MPASSINTIIDTARDILVGKLPNPQDQIDAITYTLMCKFMSDIDDDSAALGGKRAYFTGDYEKYDWHALMRADGNEQVALFRDAIEKMSRNPNLPPLFRDIFAGALLKFNDPRTLRLFLAEMDKIRHADGNDDLGDAYEYLLSIMASQGGLGQFRTPRHIIEFITAIVAPEKHHRVLDPACGTAGFLIAAYKHILSRHTAPANRLSATDRDLLHKNLRGFDIDPAMIRTARVNMYLHGFKTPDIIEHDTLTSEDRWDERYDIILANPPFMTPKGGIQPHKKFAVAANRAEVLFVDYIASHLKPKGRAGIVVPEGIIFQTANAYKQLRKNLVENQGLAAVISLPAGIFNPYAGVKTSILILDNENAPRRENILFIKIENDGYSLGAQRRPIDKNDLPAALKTAQKYLNTPAMWNAAGTDNATGSSTTTGTGTTCTLVPK
ncbi:MAG: SAM-dependent methyltransferase, partial [Puniceicoccales bacterium]|nr:SAM-dependent methyltransferase [Puniceicoccales bacterium]